MSLATTGFHSVDAEGDVYSYGPAPNYGSLASLGIHPASPVVGMSSVPRGYILAARDGGVFAFGAATYRGSLPGSGITPARPVVGIATTPGGYWLAGADGAVYTFGSAPYLGSLPGRGIHPAQPIVGIAATPSGDGYWLVGADGGVYAFGDAAFVGSLPGLHITPNRPVVGIAASPVGTGYWLVGADGGVFAFGDATYMGSGPSWTGSTRATGRWGSSRRRTEPGTTYPRRPGTPTPSVGGRPWAPSSPTLPWWCELLTGPPPAAGSGRTTYGVGQERPSRAAASSVASRCTIRAADSEVTARHPSPAHRLGTPGSPASVAAARRGRVRWWTSGYASGAASE